MSCGVCGRDGGTLVEYHGIALHDGCAPNHWRKDHNDMTTFMSKVYSWWETPAANKWKGKS